MCRSRKWVMRVTWGDIATRARTVSQQEELRPRLCHMKKGPNGYGFNLHSDKSRLNLGAPSQPGAWEGAVLCWEAPQGCRYLWRLWGGRAGVVTGTKAGTWHLHRAPKGQMSPGPSGDVVPCLQVNGVCMEGKQHADVVAAIKAGGDETRLLVVDALTDEFFKKCKVVPSEEHLAGPLPEPVANGDIGKENGGEPRSNSVSESPSSPGPLAGSPDARQTHTQEADKRHSASGSLLDLDIPLAVAKERAHQKRTSKRAPQMDWSKKNELFSNL
ncbi:Na(+)/H(+) exchange regulatory cofactor NHE-RF1 [Egretta garzetta]|uniref:Na(+)/H(+) exchange regulatory cofactor NHE-RF1 n=1 Tax=Egretta garzetta TaxID=188379 RepID=UPI00163D1522|nr:Na(+)/H(+) exchange regulatory cofactor NHE-RF1 [Egretta garzetta]